jgi:DNA-directed RNA polymerase specialized sigma24 family protein
MEERMKHTRPDYASPMPAPGSSFPSTRHSLLSLARSPDDATRHRAHDAVLSCYWKPVYKYLRVRWRVSAEDAEDLTQAFFAQAIESSFFERYDAERGRFRTYVRVCVDGFVAKTHQWAARLKRGGDAVHVPLDFTTAEGELRELPIPSTADPETMFRDEWVRRMFDLAVDDLRAQCEAAGKPIHFALFERYDLGSPESHGAGETYDDLARAFDLPVTQVTNYLAWARRHFREALLERVREVTSSEEEFRAEVRDVLGGFAP